MSANMDFSNLSALFINNTLKPTGTLSHTEALMQVPIKIMQKNKVKVEVLRAVDYDIAVGLKADMTKHGAAKDAWPTIMKKVMEADILVIGSPVWLGETSSVCRRVIERLYAQSGELNKEGQYAYYGKVAGCIITGNEDGVKHCAMSVLYALQHLGYSVPPQADAGWMGAAGPGPSYADEGSGGPENDFTQRNATFMTWNVMHLASILKKNGGFPAHGNQRSLWEAGSRFDHPNPEYR